jgi:hypothetical protein
MPVLVDATGCCVCTPHVQPHTPVEQCANHETIVCDLPCDAPEHMTCADFVKLPAVQTKGHVTVHSKSCSCPETYTPEIDGTSKLSAEHVQLHCVKKLECSCGHSGKTFSSGEMFAELTPDGKPIPCRTCSCMNGRVQCHDVPECLLFTAMPTTTTAPAHIAQLCAETGCLDDNKCHRVNDTWSKANCVQCRCTAPRATMCEVTRCPTLTCDPTKNQMEVKLKDACCSACVTLCSLDEKIYCNGKKDCPNGVDEDPEVCKNRPQQKPLVKKCADPMFEHAQTTCVPETFCRSQLCHAVRATSTCIKADNCCDCSHGTAFNGTACVAAKDSCECADERGQVRKAGSKWEDSTNPECVEHQCLHNEVITVDHSKSCAVIKECGKNEVGPMKVPGHCCAMCLPEGGTPPPPPPPKDTTPKVKSTGSPSPTKPKCETSSKCQCVEDCFQPHKCDDTAPCCDNYVCPADHERSHSGACVLKAKCVPHTPVKPKCTHPLIKHTPLVADVHGSSVYRSSQQILHSAAEVVVGGKGWVIDADKDGERELTVKFVQPVEVTGFSLQQQHIVAFTVYFSVDGKTFTPYSEHGHIKSFQGKHFPSDKLTSAFFSASVTTTYLRVKVTAVEQINGQLALPRVNGEILGCYNVPTVCEKPMNAMDEKTVDDSMISAVPVVADSPVTDIRSNGKGWRVPTNSPVKPTITITLSKDNKPVKLQSLVISGNVGEVTVRYSAHQTSSPLPVGTDEMQTGTAVSGVVSVRFSPYISATSVHVTVEAPADHSQPDYNLRVVAVACADNSLTVGSLPPAPVKPIPEVPVVHPVTDSPTTTHSPGTTLEPVPTTTSVPGATTTVTTTSVAHPTTLPPKTTCLKAMKNDGVVPESALHVTTIPEDDETTTLIVASKTVQTKTPQWVSVTFTPLSDVKEVKYTPYGKDGKPVDSPKTVKVYQTTKPTVIEFDKPVKAEHIVFVFVHTSPNTAAPQVVSVVACLQSAADDLTTTQQPGVTTTQQPGMTTTQQPGVTTTQQPGMTTTQQPGVTTTHQPGMTTTHQPGMTTTQQPGVTTTQQPGVTTTQQPGVTTTQQPGMTTTHQPDVTTTHPTTTPVPTTATTTVVPPKTCLQGMKDQGVVPSDKLSVITFVSQGTTTITVSSKKQVADTPQWVSATLTPAAVTDVQVVAYGKDGKPVDTPKTSTVSQPAKPIVVKFDTPVKADRIVFTISTTSKIELVSVVACISDEELTTTTSHPATTTQPGQTTTAQPGQTTTNPEATTTQPGQTTTSHPDLTTTHPGQTTVPTTVSATTTQVPPKTPCLINMKNQGVLPKDKVQVTRVESPTSVTFIISSKTPSTLTPQWVTVYFTSADIKNVKYVPANKDAVKSTLKPVGTSLKPGYEFDTPVSADRLVLIVSTTSPVDLVSVVACLPDDDVTTTAAAETTATTMPVTTAPTTTHQPGATTTTHQPDTTTQHPGVTTTQQPGVTTTQQPGVTTTQHPGVTTTQQPGVTTTQQPGVTTTHIPPRNVQCSKTSMKDGVIPHDKLTVTKHNDGHTTTVVVKSASTHKETPEWVSVTLTHLDDVTSVTYTPVDKNGQPVGESKTHDVHDSKKPFHAVFDTPVKADHIVIVLTHKTSSPSHVKVQSAVACLLDEELPSTTVHTTQLAHPKRADAERPATVRRHPQRPRTAKDLTDKGCKARKQLDCVRSDCSSG